MKHSFDTQSLIQAVVQTLLLLAAVTMFLVKAEHRITVLEQDCKNTKLMVLKLDGLLTNHLERSINAAQKN